MQSEIELCSILLSRSCVHVGIFLLWSHHLAAETICERQWLSLFVFVSRWYRCSSYSDCGLLYSCRPLLPALHLFLSLFSVHASREKVYFVVLCVIFLCVCLPAVLVCFLLLSLGDTAVPSILTAVSSTPLRATTSRGMVQVPPWPWSRRKQATFKN